VLNLFAPHADLLSKGKGALYKTGTLPDVRTLAGYADTSGHGQVRFVISLKNNDGAMRFKLLEAVQAGL
jgi:D-alanyl-D-alanine carboxypeptidase/D-alanyl-D-alanine-endopeptidase (penicillin-binding protein 4)